MKSRMLGLVLILFACGLLLGQVVTACGASKHPIETVTVATDTTEGSG